nr:hypothetical protein [Tanacetum cinerariifolium]
MKEEFEKLESLKISDDSFTCNTSLQNFHKEFNRMSRMDDNLFTYEVKNPGLANISCDLNKVDDSKQQMTHRLDNALWIYWTRGDDEVELTNEESSNSDDEDEVTEIFRIDTNVFNFKTPTCKAFKEFNYFLQMDQDFITKHIDGFKTYEEYKDDWIYEWNKDKSWKYNGYCNGGNFPRAYLVRNTLRYQDLEWYEALEDGKLKDEALKNIAIMEGMIDEDDESHNKDLSIWRIHAQDTAYLAD